MRYREFKTIPKGTVIKYRDGRLLHSGNAHKAGLIRIHVTGEMENPRTGESWPYYGRIPFWRIVEVDQ